MGVVVKKSKMDDFFLKKEYKLSGLTVLAIIERQIKMTVVYLLESFVSRDVEEFESK